MHSLQQEWHLYTDTVCVKSVLVCNLKIDACINAIKKFNAWTALLIIIWLNWLNLFIA